MPITALAQSESKDSDYRPFIEDGKQWVVSLGWSGDHYQSVTYRIDADTIISGHQCRKVVASSYTDADAVYYFGAVYEEKRQVWIFPPLERKAIMLYDFGVSANAKTKVMYVDVQTDLYSSRDCRVLLDYTLTLSDYPLRCIGMTDDDTTWANSFLIMEGVGSPFGPFVNYPLEESGTSFLVECKVGEEVLYNKSGWPLSKVEGWLWCQSHSCTFVEKGRTWHVLEFEMEGENRYNPLVTDYYFDYPETAPDGKIYCAMYASSGGQTSRVGLFREEAGKVFQYHGEGKPESIVYDFTLQPGDTFIDPDMGYECTVTNVSYVESNGYPLCVISIDAVGNEAGNHDPLKIEWIEGIGTSAKPITNLADRNLRDSQSCYLAYSIANDGSLFLPMTFSAPWNGWRGTQLTSKDSRYSGFDKLEYRLEYSPERDSYDLNVNGFLLLPSGRNNYIYCIERFSEDDIVNRDVTFQIEKLPPYSMERSRQEVNLSFPFFSEGINYTYINPNTHISVPKSVNRKSVNRKFFDLTGRRLAAPPARGLYIEDGKVKAK